MKITSNIHPTSAGYQKNHKHHLNLAEEFEKTLQEEIETFDIPQTEQIKLPEPPPRPSIPVASEDEFFDEDITIDDMDLEDFEDYFRQTVVC